MLLITYGDHNLILSENCPINPFPTNVPLLYPLKTSENRRFSDVFGGGGGGYRNGTLVENRLNKNPLLYFYTRHRE